MFSNRFDFVPELNVVITSHMWFSHAARLCISVPKATSRCCLPCGVDEDDEKYMRSTYDSISTSVVPPPTVRVPGPLICSNKRASNGLRRSNTLELLFLTSDGTTCSDLTKHFQATPPSGTPQRSLQVTRLYLASHH